METTEEDVVVPGRVYKKVSLASPKPTLLVFFTEGDCIVYYAHLDMWRYFLDPTVPGLELADEATSQTFLMDARRALFNAIQAR